MWLSNFISIKWWDDSFFYESLNLFLSFLFFEELQLKDNKLKDNLFLIPSLFDFFKSKAIIADKSMDSHQVIMDIDDTEEAEILINDEITLFKTASLFKYLYSIDKSKFLEVLKTFVASHSSVNSSRLAGYREFIEVYESFGEKGINSPIYQFEYNLMNEKVARLLVSNLCTY